MRLLRPSVWRAFSTSSDGATMMREGFLLGCKTALLGLRQPLQHIVCLKSMSAEAWSLAKHHKEASGGAALRRRRRHNLQ